MMRRMAWFAAAAALLFAAAPRLFFKPGDLMTTGVYYYPEAWPASQWSRDMASIRRFGFEFVHMGEFAWTVMEPEEGHWDLDWLAENVRLAGENRLGVVLCTPSATPPVWLVREHPEVLMVDATGRRMEHGSREHACWNVPLYRDYVAKAIGRLTAKFGNDPRVIGWQIDNELGHYSKRYCYCSYCQRAFQGWLQSRYGTIDRLNEAWGAVVWSQRYRQFDQIRITNPLELPDDFNPHALLDDQRWWSDAAAGYIAFQATELRKGIRNQWVTTNFVDVDQTTDPAVASKTLDFPTWTIYPVHGNLNRGELGYRLGDAAAFSFMHDLMRPISGVEGLMELQPGQVNWGASNPLPYPGAVRMWILRSFAAGAQILCTYRYRQARFGSELYHYGIVGTDGVTLTSGGEEYVQAMKEIRELRRAYDPSRREPADYAARRTALLFAYDNWWDLENHKQNTRWNTFEHVLKYYRALKSAGAPVDVISGEGDFSRYPFVVAPAYQLVDEGLVKRLTAYVANGGHLVLSCRTGQKDRNGQLREGPWQAAIVDLIGAKIPRYDVLPEPVEGRVGAQGRDYGWQSWGDILKPGPGVTVLATYADQFYAGEAAAISRRLGKGTVTYIGVDSEGGDLERELVRGMFASAGVQSRLLPDGLQVDWRDGFWVATNFTSSVQKAPVPAGAHVLVGNAEMQLAGVAIWVE
jgi:beta-galactosidase